MNRRRPAPKTAARYAALALSAFLLSGPGLAADLIGRGQTTDQGGGAVLSQTDIIGTYDAVILEENASTLRGGVMCMAARCLPQAAASRCTPAPSVRTSTRR